MLLLVLPYLYGHQGTKRSNVGSGPGQQQAWCAATQACCGLQAGLFPKQLPIDAKERTHQCSVLAEGAICAGVSFSCLLSPSTTPRPPAKQAAEDPALDERGPQGKGEESTCLQEWCLSCCRAVANQACLARCPAHSPASAATHRRAGRNGGKPRGSRGCSAAHAAWQGKKGREDRLAKG